MRELDNPQIRSDAGEATPPPGHHRPLRTAALGASPGRAAPFIPPRLERLGEWSALTLQQSIQIGPGNW